MASSAPTIAMQTFRSLWAQVMKPKGSPSNAANPASKCSMPSRKRPVSRAAKPATHRRTARSKSDRWSSSGSGAAM